MKHLLTIALPLAVCVCGCQRSDLTPNKPPHHETNLQNQANRSDLTEDEIKTALRLELEVLAGTNTDKLDTTVLDLCLLPNLEPPLSHRQLRITRSFVENPSNRESALFQIVTYIDLRPPERIITFERIEEGQIEGTPLGVPVTTGELQAAHQVVSNYWSTFGSEMTGLQPVPVLPEPTTYVAHFARGMVKRRLERISLTYEVRGMMVRMLVNSDAGFTVSGYVIDEGTK